MPDIQPQFQSFISLGYIEQMEMVHQNLVRNVGIPAELLERRRFVNNLLFGAPLVDPTHTVYPAGSLGDLANRGFGHVASTILRREGMRPVEIPASHRQPLIYGGQFRTPQPIIQIKDEGDITQRRAIWNAWKTSGFSDDCDAVTAARIERERQLHI